MGETDWRRAWLQVHKWVGRFRAILIRPIGLTGWALVGKGATDRIANPARYATSGATILPTERYTAAAQAVLSPGERINSLTMPEGNGPVVVAATPASKGPPRGRPVRTMVYLYPPTANVIDQAPSNHALLRVPIGPASLRGRAFFNVLLPV